MNKFLVLTLAVLALSVPALAHSGSSLDQAQSTQTANKDWPFMLVHTGIPWHPVSVHVPGNSQYF
jgi:hypothetical protein